MNKDAITLLKEIKAETGWSEPRIASELDISQPTVNRIINGQANCMSSTLCAIQGLHKKVCTKAIKKINEVPHRRSGDRK